MGTSVLTDTIKDPGGNVVATSSGTVVNFRLMANGSPTPGFRISDGVNVASLIVTSASTSGAISQALENNTNITPLGTYYVAEILCPTSQGGTQEWALLSSSSASPQNFHDAIAASIPSFTPITTVPPSILGGNNVFTGTNQFSGNVIFKSGLPAIDVEAYGAVSGTTTTAAATVNTAAITNAINNAQVTIAPTCSGIAQMAAVQPVRFNGVYTINDSLPLPFYYQFISESGAVIVQSCSGSDIFVSSSVNGSNQGRVENLATVGGARQYAIGCPVVGSAESGMLTWKNCQFETNHSGFMVDFASTGNYSDLWQFENCKFFDPVQVLRNSPTTTVRITDSWVETETANTANAALFVNNNQMIFDRMYGVPANPRTPAQRWVDNYLEFHAVHSRFGGEGSGMPIVYNFAPTGVAGSTSAGATYPYQNGGIISIRDCVTAAGGSTMTVRAIVNLAADLPQLTILDGNYGLAEDGAMYILDSIPGGLGSLLGATSGYAPATGNNSALRWTVDIRANLGQAPLSLAQIPSPINNTSDSRVHVAIDGENFWRANGTQGGTIASQGSPNSVFYGWPGWQYTNTLPSGSSANLWVKTSGAGTNVGWSTVG